MRWCGFTLSTCLLLCPLLGLSAQTASPSSGDVIVRMVQGLDSSTMRPGQLAMASVVRSTTEGVTRTTTASVQLVSDPSGSGYTVQLAGLVINGQMIRTASAGVSLDGLVGKVMNFGRKPGVPQLAASGTRVFLPQDTQLKFSLTQPPVQTSTAAPVRRASIPEGSSQTPAAATWQQHNVDNNRHEATLLGVAESGGTRSRALLVVRCTLVHFADSPVPQANVLYELRIPRGLVGFPIESLRCEGEGDDFNNDGRFQLGTQPETKGDVCYEGGDLPQKASEPVTMDIFPKDLHVAVQAPGSPFNVALRFSDEQKNALDTRFQLPSDTTALRAVVDPCFSVIDEAERKEKAAIVVSCPVVPDKTLREVFVLVGPSMRKLAPDGDNDDVVAWNLPRKTKARPNPPKTTLACDYGTEPAPAAAAHEKLDRKLLPIPANAVYCVFRKDGHCSTNEATN